MITPSARRSRSLGLPGLIPVLALFSVSGCNIPWTADRIYPIALASPGLPTTDEIRTAAPGEIVLSQPLGHAGILELENTVTPRDRVWQGVVTFYPRMEQGLALFPALRVGKVRSMVVCSVEGVAPHEGGVPQPQPFPICLEPPQGALVSVVPSVTALPDATQLGGTLWLRNGAVAQTGFVNWGAAGEYAVGDEGPSFTLNEPARLRASTGPAAATILKIALRYMADGSGQRLETIYITGEQQAKTSRPDVVLSHTDAFPRTVEASGAVVEILALHANILAYRVRRNFPTDRTIVADLPD
jgi:hypothetical protein